jgi:hypothetical protein
LRAGDKRAALAAAGRRQRPATAPHPPRDARPAVRGARGPGGRGRSRRREGHRPLIGLRPTAGPAAASGNRLGDQNINVLEACVQQYGSGAASHYRDYTDPYSWFCYR